MIGEIEFHDGQAYMQVNTHGTRECLPKISGLAILRLYIITRGGNMPIAWIREYVMYHAAARERRLIRRLNRRYRRRRR